MGKPREKKYDIFISYRRDGGEDEAWKLQLFLEKLGYRVFMDRSGLHSGEFDVQLHRRIDGCRDILLICSKNSMKRCADPKDWVREEILHAWKVGKNIIPVWMGDFSPEEFALLPPELEFLSRLQAVTLQREAYEESVKKLAKYLSVKPVRAWARIAAALLGAAAVLLLGWLLFSGVLGKSRGFPSTRAEIVQTDGMRDKAAAALTVLNLNLGHLGDAVNTLDDYLSGYTEDEAAVILELGRLKEIIRNQRSIYNRTVEDAIHYPYYSYLEQLTSLSEGSCQRYAEYAAAMEKMILNSQLSKAEKKKVLENFRSLLEQEGDIAIVETFLLFLPVTDRDTTLENLLIASKDWTNLSKLGSSWIGGEENEKELKRRLEMAEGNRQALLEALDRSAVAGNAGVRIEK